jgi:flavodoxin
MKSSIVIYYSHTGSNRFLAQKIAEELSCEIEDIKPRIKAQLLLMMGLSFGIKSLNKELSKYERIILCGPVWMGKFIAPLKKFAVKYKKEIKELVFVTCCGSSFEMKEKRFGHGLVFQQVKEIFRDIPVECNALPISLVLPADKQEDSEAVMKTRLSEENFTAEIKEHFDALIADLKV